MRTRSVVRAVCASIFLVTVVFVASPAALPAQTAGLLVEPYLQNQSPTSMVIGWETQGNSQSLVEYGTTTALGSSASGTSIATGGGALVHHVELTGLLPATRYYYRVTSGPISSATFFLRTAPALTSEAPFRFIAYSDCQFGSNGVKHEEIINEGVINFFALEYGLPLDESIAFSLVPGDLVSTGSNHSHWQDHFFGQAQNLYRHVPVMPALGNHEANAQLYFDYFQLPETGTAGFEEHWYYTDHQNVRVITLDTNSGFTVSQQLDWLDLVLADAGADDRIDFVFAQFHHPHKSEMWTPGESGFSSQAVGKVEQFSTTYGKPSIHFFGHTHGYSRGQSRDHNHLMVNVASAMGSLDYWWTFPNQDYEEFEYSVPEWGFMVMDVEAGADPKFRLRRVSRGNDYIFRDNEVIDDLLIRRYNNPPATPIALSPGPSSGVVPGTGTTLQASVFSDVDGDEHFESHWQVTTTAGDYSAPVVDEWQRKENWYRPPNGDPGYSVNTVTDPDISHNLLDTSLPGCTNVYWRVRYRDASLTWSNWSAELTFQVGESDAGPSAPVPLDGAEGVTMNPTLEWFPCDPPDSFDVYFGQQPVLTSADFQGNQVATTFLPGLLAPSNVYYWRIDHRTGATVTPGPTWSFTTDLEYPTLNTTEWRFDDLDAADDVPFTPAMGPSDMTPRGMLEGSDWGTDVTDGIIVPHIDGEMTSFLWLDNAYGPGIGLETFFNAPGNGGGGCCDSFHFTIIFDIFIEQSENELQALWQGNASNSNDAEFFVDCSDGGFYNAGDGYVAAGSWNKGEWVRIAHRVDYQLDTSAIFVNGVKILGDDQLNAPDWLYALGSGNPVWMISDNGGPTDVSYVRCANLALVDGLMGDDAIAALAGSDAAGIFVDDPVGELFIRGDVNGDGQLDISDAVGSLLYIFAGQANNCPDSVDGNDDGSIDVSDPIYLLGFMFGGGNAPPAPFPGCGEDLTTDTILCIASGACP